MTDDRADEGTSARPPATRTIANVNRSGAKTEINANTSEALGRWPCRRRYQCMCRAAPRYPHNSGHEPQRCKHGNKREHIKGWAHDR